MPQEVPEKIHQLLEKYHNAEKITLYDIAKFHAQFENIHPFQDGNGRVGRMIILKQCLDHNIVPVIIRDIHKAEYNRYLNKAQHEQDYKGLEAYFEKEQKYYQESTIPMIFDFDELWGLWLRSFVQQEHVSRRKIIWLILATGFSRLSINISNQDNILRSIEPDNMVRQPCFIFWKKNCENKIIWF